MAKNQAWLNKKNKRKHKKEVFNSTRRKVQAQRVKKEKEQPSPNWLSRSSVDQFITYGRSEIHSYTNPFLLDYYHRVHATTYSPVRGSSIFFDTERSVREFYQTKKKLNVCWQKDGF